MEPQPLAHIVREMQKPRESLGAFLVRRQDSDWMAR